MRGLLHREEGAHGGDAETRREGVDCKEGLGGVKGDEVGGLQPPRQPDGRGPGARDQGPRYLSPQRPPLPSGGGGVGQQRHRQEGQGAEESYHGEDGHRLHRQEHPPRGRRPHDVSRVPCGAEPRQTLRPPRPGLLRHVGQRDGTVDGRRHAVDHPDSEEFPGTADKSVGEGHEGEEERADQQPPPPPPPVREAPDEGLEDHTRQRGDGDDEAQKGVRRPKSQSQHRQKRCLAHLVGGPDHEVGGRNTREAAGTDHGASPGTMAGISSSWIRSVKARTSSSMTSCSFTVWTSILLAISS